MRAAPRSLLLLFLALVSLTGCVVDGALDPSGGGRLRFRVRLVSVAHLERVKASLESATVTVTNAVMTEKKWATFDVAFSDLGALRTAPAFSRMEVGLTDAGEGLRTFTIAIANARVEMSPPYVEYLGRDFRFALTLPGDVVRSNATKVEGRTVTWERPLDAMQHEESFVFTATFRPAAAS